MSQVEASKYKSTVKLNEFISSKEQPHLINNVKLKSESNLSASRNPKAGKKKFNAKATLFVSPPPTPTCQITCSNCTQPEIVAPTANCVESPPEERKEVQTRTRPDGTTYNVTVTVTDPAVMSECSGAGVPSIPGRPEVTAWNADVLRGSNITVNVLTTGVVADAKIRFHQPNDGTATEIAEEEIAPDENADYYNSAPYPNASRIGQTGSILSNHTFEATRTGVYTVWLAGPGNLSEVEKDDDGKPTTLNCLEPNDTGSENRGSCSTEYSQTFLTSSCTFALHVVSDTEGCETMTDIPAFQARCMENEEGDSFHGSTKVIMEDGSEKVIRDVRVGDKVWNPLLKVNSKVEEIISEDVVADLLEFKFGSSKIIVTNSHPLLTTRGYISAVAVKLGDELLMLGGQSGIVKSKRYVKKREKKFLTLFSIGTCHDLVDFM